MWLPSENINITELKELSSFLVYYTRFWRGLFFLVFKNNGKRITNLLIFSAVANLSSLVLFFPLNL